MSGTIPGTAIDLALDRMLVALAGTEGVAARIFEDRSSPFTKEEAPALNVKLTDGAPTSFGGPAPAQSLVIAKVQVDLEIYTRTAVEDDGRETPSRKLSSPVWRSAHRRLMADQALNDAPCSVRWVRSRWDRADADGTAGWAIHTYELTLVMREHDLSAHF